MRNAILKGLEIIANYLQEDPDVISIQAVDDDELDVNKREIYPLVNIRLNGVNLDDNTMTFEVTALDIRNKKKTVQRDAFNLIDDRWDNWAMCHNILKTLRDKLEIRRNESDIEFVSSNEPLIFSNAMQNGLDGMSVILTLNYPNNTINLCKEC
jgi:hypothetical protein